MIADGRRFDLAEAGPSGLTFVLAGFAAFGFVLKVLVTKELLLTRRKYEIDPAVDALEDAILKFRHVHLAPPFPREHRTCSLVGEVIPLTTLKQRG